MKDTWADMVMTRRAAGVLPLITRRVNFPNCSSADLSIAADSIRQGESSTNDMPGAARFSPSSRSDAFFEHHGTRNKASMMCRLLYNLPLFASVAHHARQVRIVALPRGLPEKAAPQTGSRRIERRCMPQPNGKGRRRKSLLETSRHFGDP
jgi:hypothetical protein